MGGHTPCFSPYDSPFEVECFPYQFILGNDRCKLEPNREFAGRLFQYKTLSRRDLIGKLPERLGVTDDQQRWVKKVD